MKQIADRSDTKTLLLDAALKLIRKQGYAATGINELCQEAGVTKGAFFHYFKSKEHLAVEAASYFVSMASGIFGSAPYRELEDPVDRILGYIDFRIAMLQWEIPQFTCLLGTMAQEAYESSPAIREACGEGIVGHATEFLLPDIEEAKQRYAPDAEWTAEGLAVYTQVVVQGAFILAKAQHSAQPAAESLVHLKRYIQLLFQTNRRRNT